jgi:hypothetical protein
MATEALKTPSITNLDTIPAAPNTSGEGGVGRLQHINDYLTTTSAVTVGSTYQLVRIPSNAKVKAVRWEAAAMTQGSFDVGLNYSDSTVDGTAANVRGTVIDADFFATAVSAASAVSKTDITNESGTYTVAKRNQPIWQAVGLSSDPGGFFDVVFTSTNTITAGALLACEVDYVI